MAQPKKTGLGKGLDALFGGVSTRQYLNRAEG